jgi:hypothetical protein
MIERGLFLRWASAHRKSAILVFSSPTDTAHDYFGIVRDQTIFYSRIELFTAGTDLGGLRRSTIVRALQKLRHSKEKSFPQILDLNLDLDLLGGWPSEELPLRIAQRFFRIRGAFGPSGEILRLSDMVKAFRNFRRVSRL